jgi:large subunit ribosomal protein L13
MKTEFTSQEPSTKQWHVLDADNTALGRIASQAARLLMGKHKATFAPFLDNGDFVIVINASKVKLTGRKEEQKVYHRHSGYPGGITQVAARKLRTQRPAKMLEDAIYGMLPKTKLGKHMYRKLHVYADDKHPHQAQKPVAFPMEQVG